MNRKLLNKNIIKLFFITICQALVFAYVIERLFAEERGLSVLEMQYLLIFFSVISFMLEIPAGVLADLWKKKYTLALGLFLCLFEFLFSIFAYNALEFSFAYIAAAIGGSLKSGTVDSILFQTLKDLKCEADYVKLKGRLKFVKYLVSGIAAVLGGYIAQFYGFEMTYWLSLCAFPFGVWLALALYEPGSVNKSITAKAHNRLFWGHLKSGLRISWTNNALRKMILVSGLTAAVLYGELHEMSMLVYPELNISLKYFGYISLCITIVGALSGLISGKLEKEIKLSSYFIPFFAMAGFALFLFGSLTVWWAIMFLIAAIGLLETLTPIFSGIIQNEAPDELRVTISSIESFSYNSISIIVGLIFGYIANLFSVQHAFQVLAGILILVTFMKPMKDKQITLY